MEKTMAEEERRQAELRERTELLAKEKEERDRAEAAKQITDEHFRKAFDFLGEEVARKGGKGHIDLCPNYIGIQLQAEFHVFMDMFIKLCNRIDVKAEKDNGIGILYVDAPSLAKYIKRMEAQAAPENKTITTSVYR
jgi:hypothetical protein